MYEARVSACVLALDTDQYRPSDTYVLHLRRRRLMDRKWSSPRKEIVAETRERDRRK